jgi:hypothetical protein
VVDLKTALATLLGSDCLSTAEAEEVKKRVSELEEKEATAKEAAAAAAASGGAGPPEEKKVPGTKLAEAVDCYRQVQRLARKLDERKISVEKAKKRLAEKQQELEQAQAALEKAKDFLAERELAEEEIRREYLAAELAVKAAPSLMADDPDGQAAMENDFLAFINFGKAVERGAVAEAPAMPSNVQSIFRKCIDIFGYEKCTGMALPGQLDVAGRGDPSQQGDPSAAQPGQAPAVSVPDAGEAAKPPAASAPNGEDEASRVSPGTPPLRPESKKQKIGDSGSVGTGGLPEKPLPAAIPMPCGGAGLGRGLFGAPLTSASVATLPGNAQASARSRSRSRASSASAPLPTELGQQDAEDAAVEVVED